MNDLMFIFENYIIQAIIFLVCLFLWLIIISMYYFIKRKVRVSNKNQSMTNFLIANKFGYLISFFASIRAGKTSTANGVMHSLEMVLMQKCISKMNEIISYFPKVAFTNVDRYIDSLNYDTDEFYSRLDQIVNDVMELFDIENAMYNNFISCKTTKSYIEEYIECYYIRVYRGIEVYSKTWRYSYVTRKTSKYLSNETMEIKDIMIAKEFYLHKYSIVYEDELSLYKGNILSNSKNEKNKGRKELKVLFGQVFEETCYYISVKQRSDDEISNEKYLYTNYLFIKERKVYNDYMPLIRYFSFRKNILNGWYGFVYRLASVFKRKIEFVSWLDSKFAYKRKRYFYDSLIRYFRSLAMVDVEIRDYDRFDNIGKENTDTQKYEKYVLTFALRDTIGNYDTYEFKFLRKILDTLSEVYDNGANTSCKGSDLMIEQGLFIFDKYINDLRKQKEEMRKEYEKKGYDYGLDD